MLSRLMASPLLHPIGSVVYRIWHNLPLPCPICRSINRMEREN